ncbi:TPA: DUF1642 domain-containing protein [Listeria monocytogenes]|uniref:DUF1642 domain-containing protein n=1 Tax=Listeria monocytogenes TaxID=1639 RepID=UPI00145350D8|nr:DUF1642 domain-containing protein [Listeria monocytogenes]CAB3441057.1 hypothetical protein GPEKOOIF_01952 [Listeria monocytogenes]
MEFKKGDRVEVIWRSELYRGAVTRVVEATDEIEVKLAKKPAIDYLFKQNQVSKVELVKLPKFVADWIEKKKENGDDLLVALDKNWQGMDDRVGDWFDVEKERYELFARAWMDGYEVEQEPLYYVPFPIFRLNTLGTAVEGDYKYLWADPATGEMGIFQSLEYPATLIESGWKTKFTEKEIKALDERYWQFRVSVEEVEGE